MVDTVDGVEHLIADNSIISINIDNNITRGTSLPNTDIPIAKCPNVYPIPNNSHSVVQSLKFAFSLIQQILCRIIIGVIINKINMIIRIVLLIQCFQVQLQLLCIL